MDPLVVLAYGAEQAPTLIGMEWYRVSTSIQCFCTTHLLTTIQINYNPVFSLILVFNPLDLHN